MTNESDKELGVIWNQMREWADVREDQGVRTDAEMKKLAGILRSFRGGLKKPRHRRRC